MRGKKRKRKGIRQRKGREGLGVFVGRTGNTGIEAKRRDEGVLVRHPGRLPGCLFNGIGVSI